MTDKPFPPYWPEQAEKDKAYDMIVPSWSVLEAQSIAVRQQMIADAEQGKGTLLQCSAPEHRRRFGSVPDYITPRNFNLHNIFCFQYLPAIEQTKADAVNLMADVVSRKGVPIGPVSKKPIGTIQELAVQVHNEMAHQLYHQAMWRRYGRRIYVLDETTYRLLALTTLPDFPCSALAMPEHSFYLKLPSSAFKFAVWNTIKQREDWQDIEGVLVSMDNITPDSPFPREMAIMAVGAAPTSTDRNLAYISIGLGPDALLSDVKIEYRGGQVVSDVGEFAGLSGHELGVLLPRTILGFLLYLQSEHPDIEPVPPTPRRHFKEIRSPKEREAALANQEKKLRPTTRLPILYIGRKLALEVEEQVKELNFDHGESTPTGRHWQLDRQVWVRGHWKNQFYGEGRLLRKMIWIKPYLKGPDVADSLRVTAMKVQKAKATGSDV